MISGLLLLPTQAELRTFTNTEGTTIEAELIKASGSEVVLRIKGGPLAQVNIATLSEADKDFIQTWIADKVLSRQVQETTIEPGETRRHYH
ncbi:MAG: hypothetical protein QNL33_08615 [Akkermansiaceae bacterium]|jgi:hypothetical protein